MAATAANDTDVNSSFQCVPQTQTHGPHLQTRRTKVPVGVSAFRSTRPALYSTPSLSRPKNGQSP